MIKTLICKPWTNYLLSTLDSYTPLPDPDTVAMLLKYGANPWATTSGGRSVLSLIVSRCPHQQTIDAWFKAAGDMSKAPWEKHGASSPVIDAIEEIGQSDQFRKSLLLRMIEQNVSTVGADLVGHSLIERLWWKIPGRALELIEAFVVYKPELATTHAAQAFLREIQPHDIEQLSSLLTGAQAAQIDQNTIPAMHEAGNRPRL